MTPCQSKYIRGGQILWVLSQTVVSHDAVQSGWPSSWCWGSGGAGFLPMSLGVLGKASAARCRRWEHITTRTRKHYWKTCISTNKRLFYMFYLLLSGYPFESQKQYYCWYFRSVLSLSLCQLPGTGDVAVSSGSLAEEIRLRTRMRGSLSWAPPRFQIIFTVQPTNR